ncbi:copper-binding protein [Variovorax paradoxus]|uniref:copper-binding protein n=1 Tax=Variovorax paradoxus TaxID=34073 RepID=UPI00277F7F23|nr:copper-binding protein [Variovorax paradoxus]MDP9928424.1 Cu/Ag efflux protein CusF [Variovorax paradoxus]
MSKIRYSFMAAVAAFAFAGAAEAQSSNADAPAVAQPAASDLTDGEIRKVDKDNKKLTIKHGPLKSLDMPSMTMVFAVSDESVLDKFQAGDKVRFDAGKMDGKIVVMRIEPAP